MHEQMLKVAKARARLSADGSTPSTADLAFATELTEQQVRDCRRLTASVTSLDRPVGDGLTTLGDLLDPVVDEPDGWLSGGLCRDDVDDALSVLPEREAKVVALRFGFVDDEPQTLEEIGQQFGVTRERIRQIEVKALAKLRERLARRIRETRGAGLAVAEPPAVPERDRAEARAWCVATFDASLLSHLFGGFLGAGGNAADRVVHQETAAVYLAAACQALTTLRVAEVRELLQAPMQGLDGATIPEYALAVPATKRSVRTVRAAVATHLRSIRPRAAA
jgi:RNA polymerase sigma factor (sigma-70 family)